MVRTWCFHFRALVESLIREQDPPSHVYDVGAQSLRRVRLFGTLWTVALQVPVSMGFHRQEYWSGLPFPTPEDLPDPGIKPVSPASPALAGRLSTTEPPEKPVVRQKKKAHKRV